MNHITLIARTITPSNSGNLGLQVIEEQGGLLLGQILSPVGSDTKILAVLKGTGIARLWAQLLGRKGRREFGCPSMTLLYVESLLQLLCRLFINAGYLLCLHNRQSFKYMAS